MSVVIWSKNGCGYCVAAKNLLEQRGIPYEERNITSDKWTRDDLLNEVPTAKTLPQIIMNGEYVGGYTELRTKLG